MERRKAIRLPSSGEIFCHGNGDFEKNTLVALLEEGWKRKLKSRDKIITTEDYLPDSFPENGCPTEADLKFKKEIVTYGNLKKFYEQVFGEKYSPEKEEERSGFERAVLERRGQARGAWGAYLAEMDYIRAVEEAQKEQELIEKGDEEGLEKLRAKQDKRQRMLVIG